MPTIFAVTCSVETLWQEYRETEKQYNSRFTSAVCLMAVPSRYFTVLDGRCRTERDFEKKAVAVPAKAK